MVISTRKIDNIDLAKYDILDDSLIPSKEFIRNFGEANDYIEAHLYTMDRTLLNSNYNVTDYKFPASYKPGEDSLTDSIILYPDRFVNDLGFDVGDYILQYNILRNKIGNSQNLLFIKEISSDRKEIRLSTNTISNSDLENLVLNFIYEIEQSSYYKDFILNFGENKLVNAVNIAIDKNTDQYTVLIKLYEELPEEFQEKNSLWIVEELSEAHVFEVICGIEIEPDVVEYLKPANFNIDVDFNAIQSSDYQNINSLYSTSVTSSYQKILNKFNDKSIELSIDYSSYENFIHFSSAKERLSNFVYKLQQIENYNHDISVLKNSPNYSASVSISSSIYNLQKNLDGIIQKFDGYENYLYYVSESNSWPKSGSFPNYILYNTTSSIATSWLGSDDPQSNIYGGQLYSSSIYDSQNQDNLIFSVPEYIVIDPNSESYLLFLNMIGQHFDNVWLYIKSVSDLYKNTNNIFEGISKDVVYFALRSLGIKLYNSKSDYNIFEYLLGATVSGSYVPQTSQYYTMVSASDYSVSGEDISKEYFKRIYHNLPLLLKSKGSNRGIRSLISTFGIPSTILNINEYGGSDKVSGSYEYSYDRFSYSLLNESGSYLSLPWSYVRYNRTNNDKFLINPDSIEFRFKPNSTILPSNTTLFQKIVSGSSVQEPMLGVTMQYTSSNSIPSANLKFILSGSSGPVSSSMTIPIYIKNSDNESYWWNIMIRRRIQNISSSNSLPQYYDVFVKNVINGNIGHQYSSSLYITGSSYNNSWNYLGNTSSVVFSNIGGTNVTSSDYLSGSNFIGNLQELRFWSENLTESSFDKHVLNPESIQGNYSSSAYEFLISRFPLGDDLYTYNNNQTSSLISDDPKTQDPYISSFPYKYEFGYDQLNSSIYYVISDSDALFYSGSNNIILFKSFPNKNNYVPNYETYFSSTPNSGYYVPVTSKVRISNQDISGSVLLPDVRQEKIDRYRTNDTHLLDISFSPNNEINKDIISQYGDIVDIDNLIGDPKDNSKQNYPQLDKLRDDYFMKYFSGYDYKDYVRLISFMDNSLFKMIEDYIPGRSNLSTGVSIKSTILDRNKVERKEPSVTYPYHTSSIENVEISADSSNRTGFGDGKDLYTGELSGSLLDMNEDFNELNKNPFALYNQNFNQYLFDHTDFNVTINNISSYPESRRFQIIDEFNSNILSPAFIQDGYYEYKRHILPRYLGSKSTSARYNFYVEGDESYGKNASIDKNTLKFAFLNEINIINLNFWDKATCNIKYLIDASGSITELNRKNDNLFDVQNIFRSGDDVTVSLLDPLNPSNQYITEGSKKIYEGGFSYSPVIYREINEDLTFDYINPSNIISNKLGIKAVMTSSVVWNASVTTYPNQNSNGSSINLNVGGTPLIGQKLSLSAGDTVPNNTWIYNNQIPLIYNGTYIDDRRVPFFPPGYNETDPLSYWLTLDYYLSNSTSSAAGGYNSTGFNGTLSTINSGTTRHVEYTAPRSSVYSLNCNLPLRITVNNNGALGQSVFKVVVVAEKKIGGFWQYLGHSKMRAISIPQNVFAVAEEGSSIWQDFGSANALRVDCYIDNLQVSLNGGDQIRFMPYIVEQRRFFGKVTGITFEILSGNSSIGNVEIYDTLTSTITPVTSVTISSTSSLFYLDTGSYDTLVFNDSASILYNNARFNPSGSTMEPRYSPVTSNFYFEEGDVIRFGTFLQLDPDLYVIRRVIDPIVYSSGSSGSFVSSSLKVILDKQLNSGVVDTQRFAFLRRTPDETSVILDFNKPEGEASSGFLIPFNIKKEISEEFANIVSPLKNKLFANVLIT